MPELRRVDCWACGHEVQGVSKAELADGLEEHFREFHDQATDPAELLSWVQRKATLADAGVHGAVVFGRVLAGAAAVTFVILAFLSVTMADGDILIFMHFMAFAALATSVALAITLLDRLLQR